MTMVTIDCRTDASLVLDIIHSHGDHNNNNNGYLLHAIFSGLVRNDTTR